MKTKAYVQELEVGEIVVINDYNFKLRKITPFNDDYFTLIFDNASFEAHRNDLITKIINKKEDV